MNRSELRRKPYAPPTIRQITEPRELAEKLATAIAELELADARARRWKSLAKKLWRNPWPNRGGLSRYGCAAIDVRMRRHGR